MEEEYKKKEINYKYNLKEYFSFVMKKKRLFFLLVITVIITQAFFITDKFLYKKVINDAEKFTSGLLQLHAFTHGLIILGILFIGIVIVRSIGRGAVEYLLALFEPKIIKELKKKYFNHVLQLSHKFHSEHKTGKLISRINRGSNAIENLTDVLVIQIGPLILQLIMVSISIAIYSPQSAIIIFGISLIFVSYSVYIQKNQNKSKARWNKAQDKESGFVADILTNIETVKYFGKERRIDNLFERVTENVRLKTKKFYTYFSYLSYGQTFIVGIGTLLILYFPLKQFLIGQMDISTIVFIYSLYGNISGNLFAFVYGIRNFYRSMADMQDLFEYGKIKNDIKDKKDAKKLKIKSGEIEFKDVTFSYGEKEIFKDFNLRIKPEEKIAFVGHSGSGKTTLVKLINRLYDVNSGKILIDKTDITDVKQQSLRSESSIVPQETILFDDTVYNNITFVNPQAKRKDVLNAIKLAQLDKIIKSFPNGLNTIVGERGVKLSGGEKQRVSIARAILSNKKVVILDEATSALDSETENEIQKALKSLLKGRTSIIIAHRLSTIMNADRIIVLKQGRIIEEGTHKQLLNKKGEYYKLWELQSGGYLQD